MSGVAGVLDRVRRALRGPHLAILAVLTMFLISCLTYRNVTHVLGVPLRWPLENWQMYASKTSTPPRVHYRRFLLHTRDGGSAPTQFAEIPFLSRAYRIDAGLAHDVPGLLEATLRERSRQDANVVGVTYETRTWEYRKRDLADHLAHDVPDYQYTARWIADRPAAPPAPGNLLVNGDFEALEPSTGFAKAWTAPKAEPPFFGFGLDPRGDHAFRFGASPAAAPIISQTVKLAPATEHRTLRVRARALASHAGASIEVHLGAQDHPGAGASSQAHPGDGSWHDLTASLDAPGDASEITVVIHGATDSLFDDVALTVEP